MWTLPPQPLRVVMSEKIKSIFNCCQHFVLALLKTPSLKRRTLQIEADLFIPPHLLKLSAWCIWEIAISLGQVLSVGPSGVHWRYRQNNLLIHGSFCKSKMEENWRILLGAPEYSHDWINLRIHQCQWLSKYPCSYGGSMLNFVCHKIGLFISKGSLKVYMH